MTEKTQPQLFMIGSEPRSGTHMLDTSLRQHPSVRCFSEVFNPHMPTWKNMKCKTVADMINGMLMHTQRSGKQWGGFCIHADQFAYDNCNVVPDTPIDWYSIPQETKVIRLRRKRKLASLISQATAIRTDQWQWFDKRMGGVGEKMYGKPNIQPYRLEKKELVQLYEDRRKADEAYKVWELRFFDILPVWYEDLVDNWEQAVNRVFQFLGLKPCEVTPMTKKNPGPPLQELITNFDELHEQCFGTPLYRMFDEVTQSQKPSGGEPT